jgi:excisionase family DNA binding protein
VRNTISHHLGISKETVYRWLDKGKIPGHRIGKLWKFKIQEIDDWVKNGMASCRGNELGNKV